MNNPVFDIDNWREIGATLAQNKTRTFLTAFGIFWGTAILALLLGGSDGFKSFMKHQLGGVSTNMAFVQPGRTSKSYHGFNKGRSISLTVTDVNQIRKAIPQIEAMSVANTFMAEVKAGTHSSTGSLTGVESDFSKIQVPIIYEGRFLNVSDETMGRKVCVLGKKIADDLFGSSSAIGHDVCVNGLYYKVVGVAGQESDVQIMSKIDESVIVTNSDLRRSYNLGDDVGFLLLTAKNGYRPSDFRDQLTRIIYKNHYVAPDDTGAIWFFDVSEQFEMVDNLFIGINLLALFVGLGTLLSGIIGVGNIMWIIVRERTKEIGIRRALGAKPRDIIIQILSEGMIMTLVAGLAGITLATAVLAIVHYALLPPGASFSFQLSLSTALEVMAAFLVPGMLAGLIPAVKAMRIKPIEALNAK